MTSTLGLKIQEASKRPQEKLPQGGWHSLRGQGAMAWSRRPSLKFKFRLCPERLTIFSKVIENRRASVSSGVLRLGGAVVMGIQGAQMPKHLAKCWRFCLPIFLFHVTVNSRVMGTLTVLLPVALRLGR